MLENRSRALAFFLHASVRRSADGEEVLPALWEDNDVTLLPGERRELSADYATRQLGRRAAVGARRGLEREGGDGRSALSRRGGAPREKGRHNT